MFLISGFFEPVEARICSFYYTKMPQTNQETMGTSWENIIYVNMRTNMFEHFRLLFLEVYVPFLF